MIDLEKLYETMMANDSVEFEINWDVTVRLIEALQEQQVEIKEMQRAIININNGGTIK